MPAKGNKKKKKRFIPKFLAKTIVNDKKDESDIL